MSLTIIKQDVDPPVTPPGHFISSSFLLMPIIISSFSFSNRACCPWRHAWSSFSCVNNAFSSISCLFLLPDLYSSIISFIGCPPLSSKEMFPVLFMLLTSISSIGTSVTTWWMSDTTHVLQAIVLWPCKSACCKKCSLVYCCSLLGRFTNKQMIEWFCGINCTQTCKSLEREISSSCFMQNVLPKNSRYISTDMKPCEIT